MKTMKCLECNNQREVEDNVILAVCYCCQDEMVELKKEDEVDGKTD